MAIRDSRSISLTPEQSVFIDRCVGSGRYQSASEVVRAALRRLQEEEDEREARAVWFRQQIQVGADQLERGDVVPAAEVFDRLERKHAALSET